MLAAIGLVVLFLIPYAISYLLWRTLTKFFTKLGYGKAGSLYKDIIDGGSCHNISGNLYTTCYVLIHPHPHTTFLVAFDPTMGIFGYYSSEGVDYNQPQLEAIYNLIKKRVL